MVVRDEEGSDDKPGRHVDQLVSWILTAFPENLVRGGSPTRTRAHKIAFLGGIVFRRVAVSWRRLGTNSPYII